MNATILEHDLLAATKKILSHKIEPKIKKNSHQFFFEQTRFTTIAMLTIKLLSFFFKLCN